jgi:hypothetical protein
MSIFIPDPFVTAVADGKFDKWRISGIIIGVGAGGRSRQFGAGMPFDN